MKKKANNDGAPSLYTLTKKWEKIWTNLNEVNIYFQSYIDTVLLVQQRIKMEPLIKSFESMKDNMQQFYDLLDETTQASKRVVKIDITLPWESEKFAAEWQGWKDYLKEQHQIDLSSRAERKQLETLKHITGDNENAAYTILDYAQANLYKMFFKLEDKRSNSKTKQPKNKKDGDFE